MPDPLRITQAIVIPADELSVEVSRSGGPGGQGVNTTDSRVRLRWTLDRSAVVGPGVKERIRRAVSSQITDEGELLVVSDVHRSQHMNLEEARERLADLVRAHLVPPRPRRPTKPTKASKQRRVDDKKRRGGVKKGRGRPDDE